MTLALLLNNKSPDKKEEKEDKKARKKKTRQKTEKEEEVEKRTRKEETTPRRTRKKNKKLAQERSPEQSTRKKHRTTYNTKQKRNLTTKKNTYRFQRKKITKQWKDKIAAHSCFSIPLLFQKAVFQRKNISSGKENAHLRPTKVQDKAAHFYKASSPSQGLDCTLS